MTVQLRRGSVNKLLVLFIAVALLIPPSSASLGDRLPDFKRCVSVTLVPFVPNLIPMLNSPPQTCIEENCGQGSAILRSSHRVEAMEED